MTMAVAGRTAVAGYKSVGAPEIGGPDYTKEVLVTVGRAGRLSVHAWHERALGMRGTKNSPSCMQGHYRPLSVLLEHFVQEF
jgi:hypothetical protein